MLDGLRELGHEVKVLEETFSTSYFARPSAILIDPQTSGLRAGVNQFKPAMAIGL